MRVVRPQRLGASYARCLAPAARSFSFFSEIPLAPADPILNTALLYKADTDPKKVNLGIGAYRTEEGKPWVLPVVQKAEEQMLSELGKTLDKEYLGVDGLATLKEATQKLILGQALSRVASVQTLSGTGSLRVAAEFIHWHLGKTKMFYSDPTWGNLPASGHGDRSVPLLGRGEEEHQIRCLVAARAAGAGGVFVPHAPVRAQPDRHGPHLGAVEADCERLRREEA